MSSLDNGTIRTLGRQNIDIVKYKRLEKKGQSMKKKSLIFLSIVISVIMLMVPKESTEVLADTDTLILVIDPGHGGSDGGAVNSGISEKDVNLTISLYMKEALENYDGIEVYLTRETDVFIELEERANISASYNADFFISIHANSNTSSSINGAEVYYPNGNYVYNYDTDISYAQIKELATNIQDGLVSLGLYDRGAVVRNAVDYIYLDGSVADYYSVIRKNKEAGIPAILIEHGYLSNTSDRINYLSTDAQLKELALSNVEAIVETFGLSELGAEISIVAPTVTEYVVGDSLDISGLVVNAKYFNGTSGVLESGEYSITGFDSSTTGNKVVTVSYYDDSEKFLVCILPEGSNVNSTMVGDVNGDGEVKASDYLIIKDSFLDGIVLSEAQTLRADVKEDGEIKASDYLMIKDYFLGVLEELPNSIEENLAEAIAVIEETTYEIQSAYLTVDDLNAQVLTQVHEVVEVDGITINDIQYEAPVDGTESEAEGVDGYYTFTISISEAEHVVTSTEKTWILAANEYENIDETE